MKFLDDTGLTKLVELIKARFTTTDTNVTAASSAASKAQSTAEAAQSAASAAQSAAETADGKADTAQTTAEAAQSAAETADSKATAAQTTANAAMPKAGGTFTGAVSGIEPTVDANLATKKYVDTKVGTVVVDTAIADAEIESIWNGPAA